MHRNVLQKLLMQEGRILLSLTGSSYESTENETLLIKQSFHRLNISSSAFGFNFLKNTLEN